MLLGRHCQWRPWPAGCLYCAAASVCARSHTVYAGTGSETDSEKIRSYLFGTKNFYWKSPCFKLQELEAKGCETLYLLNHI